MKFKSLVVALVLTIVGCSETKEYTNPVAPSLTISEGMHIVSADAMYGGRDSDGSIIVNTTAAVSYGGPENSIFVNWKWSTRTCGNSGDVVHVVTSVRNLSNQDTTSVVDVRHVFSGCTILEGEVVYLTFSIYDDNDSTHTLQDSSTVPFMVTD